MPQVFDQMNCIKKLDGLLERANTARASDLHLEPGETGYRVRLRVDGLLKQEDELAPELALAVASRLKILAGLDIGEKRIGQDGRFIHKLTTGQKLDIRVSTLPTILGEKIALRLLEGENFSLALENLGLEPAGLDGLKQILQKASGLFLVTGPTGCGKTTTLYACLKYLSRPTLNIITIEDPVEYRLPEVNQIQINPKAGLTFAGGLRSILRQDPDIVLLGEIRDPETAQIAVRAALTGHLVLTTMHTSDSLGAIHRLLEMGLEPYLLAPCLEAVLAQRLVRMLCPVCRQESEFPVTRDSFAVREKGVKAEEILSGRRLYQPGGCEKCQKTGYTGRQGIFEMLTLNDELRELIAGKASLTGLRQACVRQGLVTLWEAGLAKVAAGRTDLLELGRVLGF